MLVALALAAGARAQTPDSTAAPPSETLAAPADSLAPDASGLPRPAVAPFGPAPGRALTPVPALTAALGPEALLATRPGSFGYALGAPGRVGGVALDALAPDGAGLTLDDRPLDDLFTGAPRVDLLPGAAVGPIRAARGPWGRGHGLAASVRPFRLAVPVTELRYGGGQDGVQQVSATHAQTRRAPALVAGGSDASRLTLTGHVGSRAADGPLTGIRLRHVDALGRALVTRPGASVEVGVLHTDRREGARDGVTASSFADLFDFDASTVIRPNATRRTLKTEGWARARVALAASPLEVGLAYGLQRLIYTPGQDTTRVNGRRLAAFARQRVAGGLSVRLDAVYEPAPGLGAGPLAEAGARTRLGVTATDSLRLGPVALSASAGLHRTGSETWPSAALRAEAGPLYAAARYGARPRSRVEAAGLAGRIAPLADGPTERTLSAEVGAEVRGGPWRLEARAVGHVHTGRRELVSLDDAPLTGPPTFAVQALDGPLRQGMIGGVLGWRERARRGLYARAEATAQRVLDAGDGLRQRVDGALPRAWGVARVGVRAEGVGDGVLDLDLAAVGSGWTAFRSRWAEPVTGLLALPDPGGRFGIAIPAQATLGLEATATFSARASLFLRYDDALGDRVSAGALVTQGEPLPPHVLRFGVFWALLN